MMLFFNIGVTQYADSERITQFIPLEKKYTVNQHITQY